MIRRETIRSTNKMDDCQSPKFPAPLLIFRAGSVALEQSPLGTSRKGPGMDKARQTATREMTSTQGEVLLTPSRVRAMLAARNAYQVIKFRTTCTDCVPNM
jgi:hypothetical protein